METRTCPRRRRPSPSVRMTGKRLGAHARVVGAIPGGRVRRAPADVEDLAARIGVGLTLGTVGTSDSGGVGQEVRHRSIARNAVAISAPTLRHGLAGPKVFDTGRLTL